MHIAFIRSSCRSGSLISFLCFPIVSLVTGWNTPFQNYLMSIGGENENLESWSAVGILCGKLARNALSSMEYTTSCKIAAVLRGDWIRVGRSCFTCRDHCIIGSSSSSCVIGIGIGVGPFGLGT